MEAINHVLISPDEADTLEGGGEITRKVSEGVYTFKALMSARRSVTARRGWGGSLESYPQLGDAPIFVVSVGPRDRGACLVTFRLGVRVSP